MASRDDENSVVLVQEDSFSRTLTLNRTRQLNALNYEMISRLLELFVAYEEDPTVKLVILKGCRAILLDKDRNPKWEPSTLELISDQIMVEQYFLKLDDDEWEDLKLPARSNLPVTAIAKP